VRFAECQSWLLSCHDSPQPIRWKKMLWWM
jgi:hypothetical protein